MVILSGFIINPCWPYIGASPDGIIECSCCGKRSLEIKCPYSYRDKNIEALVENNYCLYQEHDSEITLKKDHEYYYQVQTQLLVSGLQTCDFFVWTKSDYTLVQVQTDKKIQDEIISKSSLFFQNVLLRELLAKCYTTNKQTTSTETANIQN